jgi:uncharacterized protein with von Willebrand factor type A (vWA) domain
MSEVTQEAVEVEAAIGFAAQPVAPPMVYINTAELLDEKYQDKYVEEDGEEGPKRPPSKTALELDQWSIRQGREIYDNSQLIREAIGKGVKNPELAAADFFSAAWEPEPVLVAECEDNARLQYFRALLASPAYQELHSETQFSDVASELAAAEFGKGYREVMAMAMTGDTIADEAKVLSVAKKSSQQAQQQVQTACNMANALGMSLSQPANRTSAVNSAEVGLMFKRIRENRQLQSIMRLAGRYRQLAQSRQRTKACHGVEEICGVVQTGRIEHLLPSELCLLDVPELELDLLRRIIEGTAMGYDFQGRKGEARGPIIVLVDESGSMCGEPIAHAKAIALAMAWIARHQKRYCCLASFSDGPGGVLLPMPGGECAPQQLLRWLEGFIGGGTDLEMLTEVIPHEWDNIGATDGKTDIIVITDCGLGCEPERAAAFNAWKATKNARVETIVIGGDAGDMSLISNQIHMVSSLGVEVEEVGAIMDI